MKITEEIRAMAAERRLETPIGTMWRMVWELIMSNTQAIPVTFAAKLNLMERGYFFRRCNEEASAKNYIGSNTWRAWYSIPKVPDVPCRVLRSAFDFLTDRLESFLKKTISLTRSAFDTFHSAEVDALYGFVRSHHPGVVVEPRASGEFHRFAYNCFCKVIDLAHTHWCFRKRPNSRTVQYPPAEFPLLRSCLHVPLDTQVLHCIRKLITRGDLPPFHIPRGGMGSVRSKSLD